MMPTFYANSVLIHLNDTGEISHEIGEEVFMSEMIKIIQGGQTASHMETWLMVWDYECSPNSIYIVCLTPSHYLCQWLLFLAAGRAVQLVRGSPAPMSAPWQSLSLCWGSGMPLFYRDMPQGNAWAAIRGTGASCRIGAPAWCLQRVQAHLLLSCKWTMSQAELFGKACFQSQATFLEVVSLQTFWAGAENQALPDSICKL